MPPRPSTSETERTPRLVYRQRGPLMTGWMIIVVAVILLVLSMARGGAELRLSALFLSIVGFAWVLILRPHVRLTQPGVRLANIVRDTLVPWPAVDIVECRWNLKIVTPDNHGYGSWAITVQRPQRAGGVRTNVGLGPVPPPPITDAEPASAPPNSSTADAVRMAIQIAQEDYAHAVDQGLMPAQDARVVRRLAVAPVIVLLASLALLGYAIFG